MARRLNDTEALASRPATDVEHTISVKKIDNGHIIRSSTYNCGTGEYKSSEMFSKNPPKMNRMPMGETNDAAGSRGLADTKKYMGE